MANGSINEIVSQGAKADILEILNQAKALRSEINAINKQPINLPSDSRNNSNRASSASTQIVKQREASIRSIERERLAEIKLQQQREKAFDSFEKSYAKEQAALTRAESIYTKVQNKINSLTATYNNLAAKRELGLTLNARETAQLTSLESRLTKYRNVLTKVDAGIGKYQRNVGNYASGFNPLNNAIGQFARELPNAGISFQTFAVSLSNQFGQLIDATDGVIAKNKELIAQGQPVKSLFSQILSSVLSFQTGLFVGIALFTAYSKEIGEMASNLFKSTAAFNSVEKSATALNDIRIESLKAVTEEKLALQGNLAIAKDTTRSYEDREIAAQKVLDQYPYWFESLGKEAILNGNVEKALNGVNNALLARARANAAIGRITENQTRIIDLEEERRVLLENVKAVNTQIRAIQRRSTAASNAERQAQSEDIALGKRENLKRDLAKVEEELAGLITVNNRLSRDALASQANAIGLDAKQLDGKKKLAEFELEAETNSREAFERNISALETRLSLINKENSAYGLLSTQLQLLKMAYEALYGEQEKANEETEKTLKYGTVDYYNDVISKLKEEQSAVANSSEQYKIYEEAIKSVQIQLDALTGNVPKVKELNDEVAKFLIGVQTSTLSGLGFDSMNTLIDGTFANLMEKADTSAERFAIAFNTIGNVAKDTFAFLNQNSQAYFDAQYSRLNKEKEIALQFAGDSTEGREEIERQYEERRREIRLRELKAQKDQAIFNAIINTAQGVTSALAQANIPLSVIIGALGAAQIALIASREIPAYKEGVMGHGGGLAIVGDGGRSEIIQTPSGDLFKTPSKDTLIDLPKGSNVYKSEADFLKNSGTLLGGMPHISLDNSGISKADLQAAFSPIASHLGKLKPMNVNINKSGVDAFIGSKLERTQKLNNVVNFKGYSV